MCHPPPLKHGKIYVTIKIRYLEYTYKSDLYLIQNNRGGRTLFYAAAKGGNIAF